MPSISNQNPIPIIPKKDKFTFPISFADGVENDGSKPAERATKNNIFAQNAVPTGDNAVGDLWFDTDDSNKIYRWSGTAWVSVKDGTILVGATTTFFQASIPTSLAVGDLWIDSDDGNKIYRAASVGADQITAGEWVLIEMTAGITTFAQDAIPTSLAIGDLWVDTNDGNKLYRAASVGADQITAGEWVEVPPDFANIGGSTKPADNATVGATSGTNLKDESNGTLYDVDIVKIMGNVYGDGSDGDVVISADTSLTKDMYYNNLTINSGYTLNTAGYRVFVKELLTNNGTIGRPGNAGGNGANSSSGSGAGASGGAALAAATLPGGIAGAAGGHGSGNYTNCAGVTAGGTGSSQSTCLGSNGAAGGDCTDCGAQTCTGGPGGTATASTQGAKILSFLQLGREFSAASTTLFTVAAGSGGGGGGCNRTFANDVGAAGGGGGSTGGYVLICAKNISNAALAVITAKGGNGGDGGDSVSAQGSGAGGGAGGNGGVLGLVYNSLANSGSITVAGGTGGAGGTGTGGYDSGANGSNGNAGLLVQLQI